jgi:tetratricopeptide (TPR) repeat protein
MHRLIRIEGNNVLRRIFLAVAHRATVIEQAMALVVLACIALCAPAHAAPHRLMEAINGEQPIRLQGLQITADISGSMAETTVQMEFFNPNRRPLEGNLQFPLLPGQQITAFSLDFNGKLRPAVPVEKAKGRQVFEEIERRRVDPAILEVTQGNNFKLRVFPVPAGGTRTVQIKVAEPLARQGDNWRYRLPLDYEEDLQRFAVTLNVNGVKTAPIVSGGLRDLAFDAVADGFSARFSKSGFSPKGTLDVLMPASLQAQTFVDEFGGNTYFMTEIPVSAARVARRLPKVVGLLWDSSGSGAGRNTEAEIAELGIYFKAIDNGEVRLTRLRDRPEATKAFKIVGGDWHELRKALQDTVYDGASALADWKPDAGVDEYLLVSDGLLNYGGNVFPKLAKGQTLYALNSATVADTGRLAAVAERSGGRLIAIDAHRPGNAARELMTQGVHLLDLEADGISKPQVESADPANGLMRIAGILPGGDGTLHLSLSAQGKTERMDVPVSAHAPKQILAPYFWASYRLHALEAEHEAQRGEIRRLGQQFGIPTAETSLIVLESLEDYIRYDITPPPEYQAAFEQARSTRGMLVAHQRRDHLAQVVRQFQQKLAWWETNFMVNDFGKFNPPEKLMPMRESFAAAAPMPAPVMAPPSAFAPAQENDYNRSTADAVSRPMAPIESARDTSERRAAEVAVSGRMAKSSARSEDVAGGVIGNFPADSPRRIARIPEPGQDRGADAGIRLKRWTSDAPYIARLHNASKESVYAIYLDEKPSYLNSSAFFLDASDILMEKGLPDLALRVLSNLAEMDLENRQVLRILGYRLTEAKAPQLAIPVFQKVQLLAEEEPQSFRDLGLAYAADKQYQAAIDQLNEVVMRSWDARFRDVEMIALAELNALVATESSMFHKLDVSRVDPRLLKNMPLDLRVVMTWDADNSDMDLWVTDPSGEKCFYGHALTAQGGRMSQDVTQGYGPEEFSLRRARPGKYKVEANFYGNRQQTVAGATTVQVRLTTGFGTARAKDQMTTLRLKEGGDTVFVGEFEVK